MHAKLVMIIALVIVEVVSRGKKAWRSQRAFPYSPQPVPVI